MKWLHNIQLIGAPRMLEAILREIAHERGA